MCDFRCELVAMSTLYYTDNLYLSHNPSLVSCIISLPPQSGLCYMCCDYQFCRQSFLSSELFVVLSLLHCQHFEFTIITICYDCSNCVSEYFYMIHMILYLLRYSFTAISCAHGSFCAMYVQLLLLRSFTTVFNNQMYFQVYYLCIVFLIISVAISALCLDCAPEV